jgi:L-proline amide hydrolase
MTELTVTEGVAPFRGHQTWYRVTGALDGAKAPLVCLHGGPGAAHDYLDRMAQLAQDGRAVIHYDQLGCGRSTHLRDAPAAFWTVQLFLDELDNLLAHLGIAARYHLLGQSWGGMLGAEHAVRRPPGLRALVIADSPASMRTWVTEANRLRAALPPDIQATLLRHEADGTTSSAEYQAAMLAFYDRHVCRVKPWPDEVARTFKAIEDDPTVYFTMNGPSEFHCIGTLRDWTIEDRLHQITAPTLVISGGHDEATPACVAPFVHRVPGARWEVFEASSHMPHVEETLRFMSVVGGFLAGFDGK